MNRRNMDRELLTKDELMSHLRQHGIERLEEVKRACLEPDGNISVIRVRGGDDDSPPKRNRGA